MPEETKSAFTIIGEYLDKGKKIPDDLRDELLFGALVELFKGQRKTTKDIDDMQPWVSALKWFLLIVGPALILGAGAFVWLLITHQFKFG